MTCMWIPRLTRLVLSFGVLTVLLGGAAMTARGAEEEPNPAEQPIGEVFKWLNFVIVAGGIVYIARRYGPAFFRNRADTITAAIRHAAAAKAEADRQLQDAETRLSRLDEEVAEFRAHAQRDAAAEAERVRELTHNEAEKIAAAARAEIEAAERAARLDLKLLGANLAVAGAASILAKQLTPQAQDSLFRTFVRSLEGKPN